MKPSRRRSKNDFDSDTLLSLAIGGDQFTAGNAAIKAALDTPTLKPHFAVVEAKRLLIRDPLKDNSDNKTNLRAYDACMLINDDAV
jgi:hypothetical protein